MDCCELFAVLRPVAPRLRLGVVWYLFPDESHNSDGKHLGYLQKPEDYRVCDPQLFQLLQSLLFDEFGQLVASARHTTGAEAVGLLPTGTIFYSEPLKFPAEVPFAARSALRVGWFEEALVATKEADLIFLDPDNGIECASVSRTAASGPSMCMGTTSMPFASRGQSLIIYHHLGRNGTHAQQIERLIQKARTRIRPTKSRQSNSPGIGTGLSRSLR